VGAVAPPEPVLEPLPVPPVLPFVVVWTTPLQPTVNKNASASAAQNWPVETAPEYFAGKGDAIFISYILMPHGRNRHLVRSPVVVQVSLWMRLATGARTHYSLEHSCYSKTK